MILDPQHEPAFRDYKKPLQNLEKTFRRAGIPVVLYCHIAPLDNKIIEIFKDGRRANCVCITGASPAQAVDDVKVGVARAVAQT